MEKHNKKIAEYELKLALLILKQVTLKGMKQ